MEANKTIEEASNCVFDECEGVVSATYAPNISKLILLSNNGSLYVGSKKSKLHFHQKSGFNRESDFENIHQIKGYKSF